MRTSAPTEPDAPAHAPRSARAARIEALSEAEWGRAGIVRMIGRSPALADLQERVERFALADRPALVTGESGVGKELFARALYLLSARRGRPFLTVNCAQFQDENLLISELFGHTKGAFTGAAGDRKGLFEEADGGVLFLDEVGELTPKAQAALLRALGEGEIVRLGESRARRVDVRVVAATNRDLKRMTAAGLFREDLYYRLCYLKLRVPPVRERGDDWRLIAEAYLAGLNRQHRDAKALSPAAAARLAAYAWPGNVREIRGIVDMAFCLAAGPLIEPHDFEDELEPDPEPDLLADDTLGAVAGGASAGTSWGSSARFEPRPEARPDPFGRMARGEVDFWEAVREPFLNREINRGEVRAVIERGLGASGGSYKRMLEMFGVRPHDYLKLMDFLRHHELKPNARSARP